MFIDLPSPYYADDKYIRVAYFYLVRFLTCVGFPATFTGLLSVKRETTLEHPRDSKAVEVCDG